MVDHGWVEKTGPLPSPLSLDGQPEGADPDPGDLGYYAPGDDLVLYYGDQSYFPGIVILGRLDGDAAERIAALDGSITATVDGGAVSTDLDLQDFLAHVDSGALIEGGSEQHRFMHDAAQEALRITARSTPGSARPRRSGPCSRGSPASRWMSPSSSSRRSTASSARTSPSARRSSSTSVAASRTPAASPSVTARSSATAAR